MDTITKPLIGFFFHQHLCVFGMIGFFLIGKKKNIQKGNLCFFLGSWFPLLFMQAILQHPPASSSYPGFTSWRKAMSASFEMARCAVCSVGAGYSHSCSLEDWFASIFFYIEGDKVELQSTNQSFFSCSAAFFQRLHPGTIMSSEGVNKTQCQIFRHWVL